MTDTDDLRLQLIEVCEDIGGNACGCHPPQPAHYAATILPIIAAEVARGRAAVAEEIALAIEIESALNRGATVNERAVFRRTAIVARSHKEGIK